MFQLAGVGGSLALASSLFFPSQTTHLEQKPKQSSSVFMWPELQKGLKERVELNKELLVVSNNAKQRLMELAKQLEQQRISPQEYETRFESLRKEIVDKAEDILYGARGREEYLRRYGCIKISKEAIDVIRRLNMGVVEIGAGAGHWAKVLKDNKINVIAYDSMESLPLPKEKQAFPVEKGEPNVLAKHKDRALLLVYPPPGVMAEECLQNYKGPVVIYCGEGVGGANASVRFFQELETHFDCEAVVTEFERFGTKSFERMWVMRRKKPA